MKARDNNYEELLGKEQRRRKIKMMRHSVAITLMTIFLIVVYFTWDSGTMRMVLLLGGGIYLIYVAYSLFKDSSAMFSLTDELHFEDGDIIKYNPDFRKTKKWIPMESVEKVYFNISDKPNLIFVVYEKDGLKFAESFYKQRIRERGKFIETLKDKGLFKRSTISFRELKDEIKEAKQD